VFIERSAERCAALEALKSEFPHLANDITIRQGDANIEIRDLCDKDKNWSLHRAVLFLDPYGMQAAPPRPAARNQRLARRVL
jgi:three-Cys-motif partner protein